ncbi:unnamed protein product [Onchocerca ochengi]|uniref:Helitron_like_N domain-containing protein n=1 Tax=Onchocerca ochengi TaxID=42157 RepID=A0A182ET70_ONCOC|nr:unnamed protein product [Onchocerca ochengi]
MFWDSTDGYDFKVKMINPFSGEETNMSAEIETECLIFIRLNQIKLRSEKCIHLQDAVVNDDNTTNIGRLTILLSSYAGSPRHMLEYIQDAVAYVRHYRHPDLFITSTCNPA